MDWLQNLLFDENSIAHIVLLYSFVIAVGVLLGKIKFFGVSLGVTFVLFTGIVCGHFGLTGNTQILTFLQDFGLILFVFCIGLQVGPSFFSSFKKGGIAMNLVAMGIVALNIVVAVALYYGLNGRIELPMMVVNYDFSFLFSLFCQWPHFLCKMHNPGAFCRWKTPSLPFSASVWAGKAGVITII